MKAFIVILIYVCPKYVNSIKLDYQFPDNFIFGAGTSAFQTEGAWKEDGKGENIWDRVVHTHPEWIVDHSNADIACDSYHKYKEDVQMLRTLGVDFYRFSISWSRILPSGKTNHINKAGINFYNNLIDELLANNIQPYVTMYHWDLPQPLQDEGGWLEPKLADYFVDYARVLFKNFGSRVKHWTTFNELFEICEQGYGNSIFAPFVHSPGIGGYKCGHTVLLAHARTYRMYDAEFRHLHNGTIGVALNTGWLEPYNTSDKSDVESSELGELMILGWFLDPVVYGNYPDGMIQRIKDMSLYEGYNQSRLPEFTPEEQQLLKGSIDYVALNHYTSYKSYFKKWGEGKHPSFFTDLGIVFYADPSWYSAASPWLKVVPWGFKKLLVWIKNRYNNPPVLIAENGFSDRGQLDDYDRASYYKEYLYEVLGAIYEEKCNVIGFSAWSLMDNFQITEGYTEKFGLYYVDFNDPLRPRTRKLSSYVYSNIVRTKRIDWSYFPEWPQP